MEIRLPKADMSIACFTTLFTALSMFTSRKLKLTPTTVVFEPVSEWLKVRRLPSKKISPKVNRKLLPTSRYANPESSAALTVVFNRSLGRSSEKTLIHAKTLEIALRLGEWQVTSGHLRPVRSSNGLTLEILSGDATKEKSLNSQAQVSHTINVVPISETEAADTSSPARQELPKKRRAPSSASTTASKKLRQGLKTPATKASFSTDGLMDRSQSSMQMEGLMLETG
jgi:hypothetical protein